MGFPHLSLFIFMPLLFLLSQLYLSSPFIQPLCHRDESSALLQFKESFIIDEYASSYAVVLRQSTCQKVASWKVEGNKSDCCSWDGVECDEGTGHVIGLDLSDSCLKGSINSSSSLFRLVHLQSLNLAFNDFNYSQIPSQVRDLSRLTHLNLSSSHFSGQIPLEISQLSHLSSLDLSKSYHTNFDAIPSLELINPDLRSLVGNLTRLQKLDLSSVNISSTVPNILANLSSLTFLSLSDCGLHGKFPKGIFELSNLRFLNVELNEGLTGYLPSFTWSSPLEELNLGYTSFSGELPASIGNFSFLTLLSLCDCNFFGSIPSSLGNLTKLAILELTDNAFSSNVPPSLENLVQLFYLDISYNQLTGPVHFELINLSQLVSVGLSHNLLCGEMHFGHISETQLDYLDLSNNRLSGPVTFGPITLQYLDLSNNLLTGFGQHPIFHPWTRLQLLDLRSNLLQGSLPIPPMSTLHFYISNNSLTGNIPELFCNLSSLQVLDLANNNLSGSLPQCLDNFGASLSILDLRRNKFQGSIPKTWIKGAQLRIINFSQNKFQGHLPRSLAKCSKLKVLDLSDNQFIDIFPFWLKHLPNLEVLILRSNKFNGPMGTAQTYFKFPSMRILDISYNDFTGMLPSRLLENWKTKKFENVDPLTYIQENSYEIHFSHGGYTVGKPYSYSMTMTNKGKKMLYEKVLELFTVVDVSSNKFVGEIPKSIENLRGCQLLNLSNNAFTGRILPSLGNFTELEALDLSHNNLSGEIPQQLTQLTFLGFLNVSYNNLTGLIPQGKQFDTFENNSFEGNPGLCGTPLTRKCGNFDELSFQPSIFEESQDSGSPFEFGWKIVVIGYGFGFAFGVIIGQIVIARKRDWLMKLLRIRPVSGRRRINK